LYWQKANLVENATSRSPKPLSIEEENTTTTIDNANVNVDVSRATCDNEAQTTLENASTPLAVDTKIVDNVKIEKPTMFFVFVKKNNDVIRVAVKGKKKKF
jgi:hypothetical protein